MALVFDGLNDRIIREHNSMVWGAYHTAAWMRSEKMPRFNTVLAKRQAAAPRMQSQDQLIEMVRLLNKMHGGTVEGDK